MKYVCDVCGYVYDPAVGDPDNGIAPGTKFEDLPEDFACPLCGVGNRSSPPRCLPCGYNAGQGPFVFYQHNS